MLNSIKTLKRYCKVTLNMFFNKKKFIKNTFKAALQYLLNVFILFNTVSYLKFNFKLKIDLKMCTFKNLEEILKTWRKFYNPDIGFFNYSLLVFLNTLMS